MKHKKRTSKADKMEVLIKILDLLLLIIEIVKQLLWGFGARPLSSLSF